MNTKQQGFTLVEVVISLALGGLILTAIMSLFVSFVQVWQVKKTPYESFIEHVDNCTRFLYNRLNAFENISQVKSSTSSSTKDSLLEYFHCTKLVSNQAILNGPWVLGMFSHKKLPFLYPSTQDTSSAVYEIALTLTANGLCLLLEAPEIVKQHLSEGVEHTDKTVQKYLILSPYVISLEYAHFDTEKGSWEFTKTLEQYCKQFAEKAFCQRPNGLRLKFKHDEFEAERFIFIRNDFCEKKAEQDSEKSKKSEKEKEKHGQRK